MEGKLILEVTAITKPSYGLEGSVLVTLEGSLYFDEKTTIVIARLRDEAPQVGDRFELTLTPTDAPLPVAF